ncbi:MAG: hypothetical protein PHW69_00335 [Elusimicrobiaceae bacterium]|nr:hypothetical protein [Elusimicrobiaceae bacterium]
MNTKTLSDISGWLKTTDLAELIYKKGRAGFELRTEEALPRTELPACAYTTISSPGVGIYRRSVKGKTAVFSEGARISRGDSLGYIEVLNTEKPVLADTDGIIRIVCVEDGAPAHYGQPLYFIEPS